MRLAAQGKLTLATCAFACLMAGDLLASDFVPEVYRDEFVTIKSGFKDHVPPALQFGDTVELIVAIKFDPDSVIVSAPDETFFVEAWPDGSGPALKKWHVRDLERGPNGEAVLSAQFQFQFLGCPDGEQTCAGNRTFLLPDFSLRYRLSDPANGNADGRIATFRIAPDRLTVVTAIEVDDEGELRPFNHYFPAGGYPKPAAAADQRSIWLLITAVSLTFLTGASYMWFFRKQGSRDVPADTPRWQSLLTELEKSDDKTSPLFADNLRRCLVWFCYDELQVDAFEWLDLAEIADDPIAANSAPEIRQLFVGLLQHPAGCGEDVFAAFKSIAHARPGS